MPEPDATITYVLRCHSTACIPKLRAALFSVAAQQYEFKQALVALQHMTPDDAAQVEQAARETFQGTGLQVDTVNFEFATAEDHRGALLNRALGQVRSRYAAFLDYDDVVYPNHADVLIEDLSRGGSTQAVASFGGCIAAVYDDLENGAIYIRKKFPYRPFPSVMACLMENCFPIHSYVLDLSRIDVLPKFRTDSPLFEDYYFLLGLFEHYPVSTRPAHVPVCEYRMNSDDSNTVSVGAEAGGSSDTKTRGWREARTEVDRFKRDRCFIVPYREVESGLNVRMLTRQPFLRGLLTCQVAKTIMKKWGEEEACRFLVDPKKYARGADAKHKDWVMRLFF